MLRVILPSVGLAFALAQAGEPQPDPAQVVFETSIDDVLDEARGVAPAFCWHAAQAVTGGGSGNYWDVPHPPLGRDVTRRVRQQRRDSLNAADRQRIRSGMLSSDDCEREIATRLAGQRHREFDAAELNDMLTELLTHELSPTRISAAIAAGLAEAGQVLDQLHRSLGDADARVRANSAWAVGRIRAAESATILSRSLSDADDVVRATAVGALARIQPDEPTLLRVLREDRSPEVRRVAAWALQRARSDAAIQGLTTAARSDADEEVREMAVWALAHTRDRNTAEVLGELVRTDRSAKVRATAIWGVGQLSPRSLPAPVVAALADEDRSVRLRAAWAAGQVRDAQAIPALRQALQREQDGRIQQALIRALVLTGDRDSAALEELLASSNDEVRRHAVLALAGRRGPWPWPWPQPRPYP